MFTQSLVGSNREGTVVNLEELTWDARDSCDPDALNAHTERLEGLLS